MANAEPSRRSDKPPSLGQLAWQFLGGSIHLLFASAILTGVSRGIVSTTAVEPPSAWLLLARTLIVLSAGTLLMLVITLVWLFHLATGQQGRRRQFGLVSVFLTTALLAAYLALVRWLVVGIWTAEPPLWGFATIGFVALLLLAIGFIPLLGWMNCLVWCAVRVAQTRVAQRWLFARHRD